MAKHVCPWWLAYTFDNPLRSFFHKSDLMLSPYVKEGMTVADFGCGFGCFSIALARIIGETGKVIAVDIQPEMLARASYRAKKAGVAKVIEFRVCKEDSIEIDEPLDFALAFWMAHETPNVEKFFSQIHKILKPSSKLLVTEPKFHVSAAGFKDELDIASDVGFTIKEKPVISFSHAVLMQKAPWFT